jgi:hypothetical protein
MQMDLFGHIENDAVVENFNPWDYEDKFNDFDYLALEYREANDRRRGEIALVFVSRFENLVRKQVNAYVARQKSATKKYYKEEAMAIWRLKVCEYLDRWDGSQSNKYEFLNFLAYLLPVAKLLVTSELHHKIVMRDARYKSTDTETNQDKTLEDFWNGCTFDNNSFVAYETALMLGAFLVDPKEADQDDRKLRVIRRLRNQGFRGVTIETMADDVVTEWSVREIDGYYVSRNENLWANREEKKSSFMEEHACNVGTSARERAAGAE